MFGDFDFGQLNEADVREEVISPLLHRLGYRSGTAADIIRELSLRYPKAYLGHKDDARDPELRGRADYICEVQGRLRWAIEAKSPQNEIELDAIEQAYTYANHPEVRAVYFAVANGPRFVVFRTNEGPSAKPVIDSSYGDLEASFPAIKSILGPAELLKSFPEFVPDTGQALAPGLRSVARITAGSISYDQASVSAPVLTEMVMSIVEGAVQRREEGGIALYIRVASPIKSLNEYARRTGQEIMELTTTDETISTSYHDPTVFIGLSALTFYKGETLLDPNTWKQFTVPTTIHCDIETRASGWLDRQWFRGEFQLTMSYREVQEAVSMRGTFEAHIA